MFKTNTKISHSNLKLDGQNNGMGLKEKWKLFRDEWGIAHIYTKNINDLTFYKVLYMHKTGCFKWS